MIRYTTCSLCEASCGVAVEIDDDRPDRILSIRPDERDEFSRGYMCPKGTALQDLYEDPDRLTHPIRRIGTGPETRWEELGWDAALDLAADRIHAIRSRHGKDAVALYVGNPSAHNHELLLMGTPLVAELGTRNRYSATSADQLPHMFAAMHMYGHQVVLSVPDLERTELLVIMGANPLASNGSFMTAPGVGKRLKEIQGRGGRVVVLDPRRTETAELADEHHFIRPGTDALFLLAVLQVVFAEDRVRAGTWQAQAEGLEELRRAAMPFTPERVADATGVPADVTRSLALALADTERAALYGRIGLCTQEFGGLNGWLLNAVNVVTGHLDVPGGMMFPSPAVDLVTLLARIGQTGSYDRYRSRVSGLPEFGGEMPVSALAEEIETPGERQVRGLLTLCGNPVLSIPNGPRLEAALERLDFMVSVDMYLNETTRHADLILPGVSALERDYFGLAMNAVSVRNHAKFSPAVMPRRGSGRPEWEIALELTERLQRRAGGLRGRVMAAGTRLMRRAGPRRTLDLMLRTGPYGTLGGLLGARRRGAPGGADVVVRTSLDLAKLLHDPHGIDLGPLEPRLGERLYTPERKIRLAPPVLLGDLPRLEATLAPEAEAPGGDALEGERDGDGEANGEGDLALIGRRHLRSNNSWMHNSRRLVKGKERCTLLMHPDDARDRGLEDGQRVKIRSRVGEVLAPLVLDDAIMPGVVSLPHGWGHGQRPGTRMAVAADTPGPSANDLTDESFVDSLTGTAGFNGVPVTVEPASA